MSRLIFAATFALALALAGGADARGASKFPPDPYKLDAKGKCHAANGQSARRSMCPASAPQQRCRDSKTGKVIKCVTGEH